MAQWFAGILARRDGPQAIVPNQAVVLGGHTDPVSVARLRHLALVPETETQHGGVSGARTWIPYSEPGALHGSSEGN